MSRIRDGLARTKKRESFFSGVAVLTVSALLVKAIGALFKIPMLKYIGIEGMGYFNAAYHFYSLLMTVSTAGLPVALSILISRSLAHRDVSAVRRHYRCAFTLFCSLGALFSLLMLVFAERIAILLGIPNTKYCLYAVSPAVFFVTVSGAVRGYFQGYGIMNPTALSQVIEALGKLILGLGFAIYAKSKGYPPYVIAAYAIFGLTLGLLLSALYLLLAKRIHVRKNNDFTNESTRTDIKGTYSAIIKTALPVTLSSAVLSLTTLLDTLVIPTALMRSGMDEYTSLSLYSTYTNLALPLFAFPTAFITPISLVLVPAAATAEGKRDYEHRNSVFDSSLRLCAVMILPCAFGIGVLSQPILSLIFSGESAATAIGARLLSVLSVSIFFSGLMTVSNAMLQSCSKQKYPVLSLAIGAAVKLVSEAILVSLPAVNIYGAPISTFLCSLSVIAVNFHFLSRLNQSDLSPMKLFMRPLLCAALSGLVALVAYSLLSRALTPVPSLFLSVAITAVAYALMSLKAGAVPKEDIRFLPGGERIYKAFEALKLIR